MDDTCQVNQVHPDKQERIKNSLPKDEDMKDLANFFFLFGDYTRVRILYALAQEEICVCDIAEIIDMSQSAVSHQLRLLKNHRLVKSERRGKMVFYSLDDHHIQEILDVGLAHIKHS